MRWDRKKLPKPNLHVYGEDDIKIRVYNIKKVAKDGRSKNTREKRKKNKLLKKRTLDS